MNILGIVLMGFACLIFLALVTGAVVLIVFLTRRSSSQAPAISTASGAPGAPSEPLAIVQQRYASGAISREEYTQIVNDLTQK